LIVSGKGLSAKAKRPYGIKNEFASNHGNEHWVAVVAVESMGDVRVEVATAFAAMPVTDELPSFNPDAAAVALEVLIAKPEHPLPMFPLASSFNTHTSALPAPKEEVSPATI
jgi:aspartokinase-like uncharacterized kinase